MEINEEKLMLAIANKGLKIKEICCQIPISENSFRAIRKKEACPRISTLGKIAKALDVRVEDLVDMDENVERPKEHEEYYSIPESIFGHHELTDEKKKEYEDYFRKVLKKEE